MLELKLYSVKIKLKIWKEINIPKWAETRYSIIEDATVFHYNENLTKGNEDTTLKGQCHEKSF